jgi:hypothetical protein
MAMEPVGTLRDCRSGYWLYFYYHGRSYQHFIGRFIADRALPLFVGRYVQHQSDYLFIKK